MTEVPSVNPKLKRKLESVTWYPNHQNYENTYFIISQSNRQLKNIKVHQSLTMVESFMLNFIIPLTY